VLLLEADAGQFKRKSFVARLLAEPDLKGHLGFIPSPQAGQRCSVVIVDVGGAFAFDLRNTNDLLPSFFREELFDFGSAVGESRLRPEGKCGKGEDKQYSCFSQLSQKITAKKRRTRRKNRRNLRLLRFFVVDFHSFRGVTTRHVGFLRKWT